MKSSITTFWFRLFFEDYWSIGLIETSNILTLKGTVSFPDSKIHWINGSNKFFLADPHWLDESKRVIVCEKLNYLERKGKLVVVYLGDDWQIKKIKPINSYSNHYSYPQVLTLDNKVYIIPESALDNYQKMLEIDRDKFDVNKEYVLINNCQLIDPTIFQYKDKFWLFANPLSNYNHHLHIYTSDCITGPWIPLSINPISIENCRGAGSVYVKDGNLYWPCQYNEHTYGGGVIIRKIIELDQFTFLYDTEALLMPDKESKYSLGLHTLNIGNTKTLIDGKRNSLQLTKPFKVLYSRIFMRQ